MPIVSLARRLAGLTSDEVAFYYIIVEPVLCELKSIRMATRRQSPEGDFRRVEITRMRAHCTARPIVQRCSVSRSVIFLAISHPVGYVMHFDFLPTGFRGIPGALLPKLVLSFLSNFSTRDVWHWRSLINSKDRPCRLAAKFARPSPRRLVLSRRDFYPGCHPLLVDAERRKERRCDR